MRAQNLPEAIKVRFVRVKLKTGKNEVLVTRLLDEIEFSSEEFLEIYHLRGGVEGFYAIVKTRLNLENFSDKTAESVYQDFYSTIYLSGIESIFTEDTDEQLAEKPNKKSIERFHFMPFKNQQALELLLGSKQ